MCLYGRGLSYRASLTTVARLITGPVALPSKEKARYRFVEQVVS